MTNNNCLMRFSRPALQALAAMGIVLFLLPQISQVAQRGQGPPQPGAREFRIKDKSPYDKHDFNGFWVRNPAAQYNQPECPECRDTGPSYGYFGAVFNFFDDSGRRKEIPAEQAHEKGYNG